MIVRDIPHARLLITLLCIMLAGVGCSNVPSRVSSEGFETVKAPYMTPPQQQNGAIFQAGYEISLYEDIRARRVGDILTVVLTERTDASKQAATSTTKDTAIDMANPLLLGKNPSLSLPRLFKPSLKGRSLENNVASTTEFSGEGDSSQSNSLSGNITVTVAEVYPNGNLFVRGQKRLTINQGDEYVQFSGIVRVADISPDNTVLSTKVADARIAYIGEGTLADSNTKGWLTSFFDSKWWPF